LSFLTTIEEQCLIGFTGRINILQKVNGRFLGAVFIFEGSIVGARFAQDEGERCLFQVVAIDHSSPEALRFVVEPEILKPSDHKFLMDFEDLSNKLNQFVAGANKGQPVKNLRPPDNTRLVLNADFLKVETPVAAIEFDIMCLVSENAKAKELYRLSPYHESQTTDALVSLRKKGALKVVR
jgi:hypothetical protein